MNKIIDTALIISPDANFLNASEIIGTGGWLPPEKREELDWMTLIKFLGWKAVLIQPEDCKAGLFDTMNIKWLILTGDPDLFEDVVLVNILSILKEKPILLISQAGREGGTLAKYSSCYLAEDVCCGNILQYEGIGKKRNWECRNNIEISSLKFNSNFDVSPIITLEGKVIVAGTKIGLGKIIGLSFHPGILRDQEGCFSALLKHLLIFESKVPVVWYNWENTLILRMDDTGSSEVVYYDWHQNAKLDEQQWETIGNKLRARNARMSLGYVSGWVDDGDADRGKLTIAGCPSVRFKGKVYPSSLVRYESIGKKRIYDFEAEFRGIQKLRNQGLVDVELHGFTHLHPDRNTWADAADRYTNVSWYREFGHEKIAFLKENPEREHPLYEGFRALSACFDKVPTTLICPGEEFTNDVLQKALHVGLMIVSSYYMAVRIGNQLCWAQHICAPYLDIADALWFDPELPVVGYFHDFDISIHGVDWLSGCLDNWQKAGAKFFIDFRELSNILCHTISINEIGSQYQLSLNSENYPSFIKPVRIGVHIPDKNITSKFLLHNNHEIHTINVSGFKE